MKLENITICYNDLVVLDNLTLNLPNTGIVCFFAPSGSGKTTLLRLVSGLLKPISGKVIGFEGKKFATVFQEDRLIESMTVEENISLVLKKENSTLVQSYLNELNLKDWGSSYPNELSGGMQRRVAIARAFAYAAENRGKVVFLLDEPLKGLDEQTADKVMNFMKEHSKNELVLFVTHDRKQAEKISDKIICFSGKPMKIEEEIEIEHNI